MTSPPSQMIEEFGNALPVAATIDISDGNPRQVLVRDVFQAADVDAIHLADRRFVAHAIGAHAAVLAKVVMVLSGIEQVLGQIAFPAQQLEALRLDHGRPEAGSPAYRAVASIGAL